MCVCVCFFVLGWGHLIFKLRFVNSAWGTSTNSYEPPFDRGFRRALAKDPPQEELGTFLCFLRTSKGQSRLDASSVSGWFPLEAGTDAPVKFIQRIVGKVCFGNCRVKKDAPLPQTHPLPPPSRPNPPKASLAAKRKSRWPPARSAAGSC